MNIAQIERQIRRLKGGREYLEFIKGISPDRFLSIEDLELVVCEVYNLQPFQLKIRSRHTMYAYPRQMLCFLNDYYGVETVTSLARRLEMDHTSCLYGKDRIKGFLDIKDPQTVNNFNKCREIIENETTAFTRRGGNEGVFNATILH